MKALNIFRPSALKELIFQDNACDSGIPRARYLRQRIPQHTVDKTESSNSNRCDEQVVLLLAERPNLC